MSLDPIVPKWFAVSTKSKCEKAAHQLLTSNKIESYVPLQKKQHQFPSGRKRWVEKPLITCYAFVKITSGQYTTVLQTDYVLKFVKTDQKLRAIPDTEMSILRQVANEQDLDVVALQHHFQPGEEIEIYRGSLAGIKGKLIDIQGQKKVIVELNTIGQSLQINVNRQYIRPAWMSL